MSVLETQRLILRPVEPADLDNLVALFSDPDVMRYIAPVRSRDETQAWLDRSLAHWQQHGFGNRIMLLRDNGAFVGRCGVNWGPFVKDAPEVAYTLLPGFWGQGLATEAARKLIEHSFAELKLPRLVALAERGNIASRHVIEKLGMVYRHDLPLDGHDALVYEKASRRFRRDVAPPCEGAG